MQKLFKLKRYSYVEFLLVSWKEFIYVYAILFLSRCTVLCANMYTLYISLYADAKKKKIIIEISLRLDCTLSD